MGIRKFVPYMVILLLLSAAGGAVFYLPRSSRAEAKAAKLKSLESRITAADGTQPRGPQEEPAPLPVAVPGLNENMYVWKLNDVVRFDYAKTVTLQQLDDQDKPVERVFELNGFMILEIKTVTPSGATARLRFEPKRDCVLIPELYLFTPQYAEPQLLAGKSKTVSAAMSSILTSKTATWDVKISNSGLIYIEKRTPANLRDWFKEVETAGTWRRKSLEILPNLIEQDLGLKVPSHDRSIFLCLSDATPAGGAPVDPLRPHRQIVSSTVASEDDTKTIVTFSQLKPAVTNSYDVPGLTLKNKISVTLKEVTTRTGKAVFDTQLGLLDSINEDYTIKLLYQYGTDLKLNQTVRVQYRLKRLIVTKQ